MLANSRIVSESSRMKFESTSSEKIEQAIAPVHAARDQALEVADRALARGCLRRCRTTNTTSASTSGTEMFAVGGVQRERRDVRAEDVELVARCSSAAGCSRSGWRTR